MATTKRAQAGRPDAPREERAVYVISVAAELAGMHPQTLRSYERLGLVRPSRTEGRARRYSDRDIARLRAIQILTQEQGINLAGAKVIMDMQAQLEELQRIMDTMQRDLADAGKAPRAMPAAPTGLIPRSSLIKLMAWQEGLMD